MSEATSPSEAILKRFLPLGPYLAANGILWEDYVADLMGAAVPAPIIINGRPFLDRGDEAAYRGRLRARALHRMAALATDAEAMR
jgi:hypothetical protein